jgi:uncharacterized protein YndB with AHSA1/START domain
MSKIIQQSVSLNCNAVAAFQEFTKAERLVRWLARDAEVEPELGGKYELFWDTEERDRNSTRGCRITAIEPPRLLAFDWKGPEQFRHFMNVAQPLTHVAIFFLPVSATTTEAHLLHTGWGDTPAWDEARQWFERAWSGAFAALKNQVNEQDSTKQTPA